MDIFNSIISIYNSVFSGIENHIFWTRIASAIISGIFLWGIIYYIAKSGFVGIRAERFFDVMGAKNLNRKRSVKAWKQIGKRLSIGDDAQVKLAIIEADRILDEVLKKAGFAGETMADRLKQITPAQLPNIDEVWQAHKLRNRIAHESDFIITQGEAELAIEIYEAALKEFDFIE